MQHRGLGWIPRRLSGRGLRLVFQASRSQAFARSENEVLDRDDVLAHAGNVEQDDLMGRDVVVLCDAEVRIEPTSSVELTRRDLHLGEAREMQCAEVKLVLPI